MAGFTVKIDRDRFDRRLEALAQGMARPRALMQVFGEIALTSINENFEKGGRPPWKPLSAVTVRLKAKQGAAAPDRILFFKGYLRRIGYQATDNHVVIGTAPNTSRYAAIQQFGGQAGRGHKVTIPARPYLVLQDEDVEEMKEAGILYVRNLGK